MTNKEFRREMQEAERVDEGDTVRVEFSVAKNLKCWASRVKEVE